MESAQHVGQSARPEIHTRKFSPLLRAIMAPDPGQLQLVVSDRLKLLSVHFEVKAAMSRVGQLIRQHLLFPRYLDCGVSR